MLQSLGTLYTTGAHLSCEHIYPKHTFIKSALPTYPFKRERFWLTEEEMQLDGTSAPGIKSNRQKWLSELPENNFRLNQVIDFQCEVKKEAHSNESLAKKTDGSQNLICEKTWVEQEIRVQNSETNEDEITVVIDDLLMAKILYDQRKKNEEIISISTRTKDKFSLRSKSDNPVFEMNDSSVEASEAVLQQIFLKKGATYTFIFTHDLQQLEHAVKDDSVDSVFAFLHQACSNFLCLLQALGKWSFDYRCRLVLVTAPYSIHSSDTTLHPVLSCLAAIARSAQLEMPEIKIKTVEIDMRSPEILKSILHTELSAASFTETEVAYSGQKRFVSRLQELKKLNRNNTSSLFSGDEVYLITGGTGAIGSALLPWMVSKGAHHFILTHRNEVLEARRQALNECIESVGGSIQWCKVDIASEGSLPILQSVIGHIKRPLGGIFHLAGLLRDKVLNNLSWEDIQTVFQPKIAGILHLHKLSLHYQPSQFVCFSSIATLFGSPGQTNYAAANAFMDAFIQWRRNSDLPGLSINWGIWEGQGMGNKATSHKTGDVEIIRKTTVSENLAALEILLRDKTSNAAVFSLNLSAHPKHLPIPLLSRLLSNIDIKLSDFEFSTASFTNQLLSAKPEEQEKMLMEAMRSEVNQTMGNPADFALDPNMGFASVGMDSIMAVELQQRLQQKLQVSFSITALFNYNSLAALTAYLLTRIKEQNNGHEITHLSISPLARKDSNTNNNKVKRESIDFDKLSDEEAVNLLEEVLARKNISLV